MRLILTDLDGSIISSPILEPDNPRHGRDHPSIIRKAIKIGNSMKKYKQIKAYIVEV